MAGKKHTAEQIVARYGKLKSPRQRENHPTGLSRDRHHHTDVLSLAKEYGGLKLDQARRMKELEKENSRLKRVVAELSLEKQILKDVAEGNF